MSIRGQITPTTNNLWRFLRKPIPIRIYMYLLTTLFIHKISLTRTLLIFEEALYSQAIHIGVLMHVLDHETTVECHHVRTILK